MIDSSIQIDFKKKKSITKLDQKIELSNQAKKIIVEDFQK